MFQVVSYRKQFLAKEKQFSPRNVGHMEQLGSEFKKEKSKYQIVLLQ